MKETCWKCNGTQLDDNGEPGCVVCTPQLFK